VVSGWVEELPELLLNATDHGATMVWRARSAEMRAPWSTRQYLALQVRKTAEQAEIVETEQVQLGLVQSMSMLVLVVAGCGAEAVQDMHLPGMMTSMFWGLGLLVSALVPVEMLQLCAAPASRVGAMLALISVARKRRPGVDRAAQVVRLYVHVHYWLENDGLMKGAPVPVERSALLAAVLTRQQYVARWWYGRRTRLGPEGIQRSIIDW
jgi:hypothetical protein